MCLAEAAQAAALGKLLPRVFTSPFSHTPIIGVPLSLPRPQANDINKVLGMILKCGEVNLAAMEMLDHGHTSK